MMSTISHTMRTIGKSNGALKLTPNRNDGAMRDVLVGYISPPPPYGRYSSELPQALRLSN